VPFSVSQRTLQQLDWQAVVARLVAHAATPRGRARLASDAGDADGEASTALFTASAGEARERMAETGEARALLDAGDAPPLGGVSDLTPALRRLAAGGVLGARELLDLGQALAALRDTRRFLHARREAAPGLASRADTIEDQPALAEEIAWCLDPEGDVRDAASPALHAGCASRKLDPTESPEDSRTPATPAAPWVRPSARSC